MCQEISKQVKSSDELNWIQKEYLSQFILLPAKHKEVVIETMLEMKRRGNFIRIYPTKSIMLYIYFL